MAASSAIFQELFGAHESPRALEKEVARTVAALGEALRRVRRRLDRGAPRAEGVAMRKAAAALTAARELTPRLAALEARR